VTAVDPVHPDADIAAADRMLAGWDAEPEPAEGWSDILARNWETRPGTPTARCASLTNLTNGAGHDQPNP
jgi:hypothetical protein